MPNIMPHVKIKFMQIKYIFYKSNKYFKSLW